MRKVNMDWRRNNISKNMTLLLDCLLYIFCLCALWLGILKFLFFKSSPFFTKNKNEITNQLFEIKERVEMLLEIRGKG